MQWIVLAVGSRAAAVAAYAVVTALWELSATSPPAR
jgi:hypothetical protein